MRDHSAPVCRYTESMLTNQPQLEAIYPTFSTSLSEAENQGKPVNMLKRDFIQTEPSNEILAARVARHDLDALETIYDRFASRVFTLAAMLLDCAQAEHIVLQVFSRLWLEADQFKLQESTFQDWFLSLTRAHILTRLARDGRQTVQDRIDAINHWLSEEATQTVKVREELHKPSAGHLDWQVFQDLTNEQRCAIVLAHYGGFKQKEIAELLSLPSSAVNQHIQQGLQSLRKTELVLERG